MKVGKVEVTWTHYITGNRLMGKVSEDEKVKKAPSAKSGSSVAGTECMLRIKGRKALALGETILNPRDKFDVEKGRVLSLTRAMAIAQIKRPMRIKIWNKYFGAI